MRRSREMANVRFVRTTKAKQISRQEYDNNALYFCTDSGELYRSNQLLSDGVRIVQTYAELPRLEEAADGVMYYTEDSQKGYILNSGRDGWIQILYAPITDINGNIAYNPSMSSLVDAYFDVAHNEIPLSQIWSPQYEFNNYLDFNTIQSAMCDTLNSGLNHINVNPELSWDDYMATNGLSEMTNIDYYNYLNQTIGSLDPITDMASIDVYNQQLMMLDYCNYNNLDFGTAFYDNCFDL